MRPLLGRFAGINKLANYRNRVEVHATKNIEGQPHILASFDRSGIAFPGGGIEHGGAVSSAKREMLEEAGYSIKKPKLVSKGQRYTMSQKWQDESLSKRGKQYKGVNNHIVHAELDSSDERLLNVEGDAMSGLKLIPVEQAHHMLRRQERMAEFNDKDDWSQRATASRVALERKYPHLRKMASKRRDSVTLADSRLVGRKMQSDIMYEGKRAGKVFIQDVDDWERSPVKKPHSSIHIFLNSDKRGRRIGREGYRLATEQSDKDEIYAYMAKKNKASIRAAEHAGFVRVHPESRQYVMKWERSGRPALRKHASVERDLLIEADKDPGIAGFVRPDSKAERVAFTHKGEVVGFMTPRLDPDGYHRVGAVYVKPEHRGKGIASKNIAKYMRGKKSKVWIDDDNVATARAHAKAGYKKGRRAAKDAHWYIKEAAAPRDYKREYRLFHSSPEAKRNRAKRNLWNRRLKGKVPAGYEIDHKHQLRDGGSNGGDNIRFLPISKNRAEHNRGRVVKDHMRKESSALKGAIIGGGLGGMIGGLDSPDGMRLGNAVKGAVIGGALGGGIGAMHRMMSPATFNLSKEQMAKLPKNFSGDMFVRDGDKIRRLYMDASGKVTVKGYAPEMASKFGKSDLLINTTKTASFDPHQWVYDSLIKQAQAVAVKRDPAKWEAAKREAKAKMGGKHSARAMQLATQIYKKKGGTYSGKKPSPSSNKLKKWTKQDWQWSKGDHGVYLPKRSASALKSSKAGRGKLLNAERAKRQATAQGVQFSRHGLHTGKKRSDVS